MPTGSSRVAVVILAGSLLSLGCRRTADRPAAQQTDQAAALPTLDAGRFARSSAIDNPWLPLTPGTRLVYEGTAVEDDGKTVPHKIVVHVTDLTKLIAGVRTAVTWDLDYNDGEMIEAELAFYAQDTSGTVWYLGEYPEEYEDGKFVAARPWIHGFDNASAGIMMPADPRSGTPSYAEGWGPAVEWTDRGQVDQTGQRLCVAAGCYDSVLVIAETSAGEPDAQQLKFYARGTGNVRVGWRGGGEKTQETLELVRVDRLGTAVMDSVRAEALKLEQSAYQHSTTVYAHTRPAERIASQ